MSLAATFTTIAFADKCIFESRSSSMEPAID